MNVPRFPYLLKRIGLRLCRDPKVTAKTFTCVAQDWVKILAHKVSHVSATSPDARDQTNMNWTASGYEIKRCVGTCLVLTVFLGLEVAQDKLMNPNVNRIVNEAFDCCFQSPFRTKITSRDNRSRSHAK